MTNQTEYDLGHCCACLKQKPIDQMQNLVMLHFRSPYGYGWGCFQCGLPLEGALAVYCDDCIEIGAEPQEFIKGQAPLKQRAPIAELTGPFNHNLGLHPEVPAEDGEDSSLDSQEEDFDWEDDPVVLFDPIGGPVTDSQLRAIVEEVRQQQEGGRTGSLPTIEEMAGILKEQENIGQEYGQ